MTNYCILILAALLANADSQLTCGPNQITNGNQCICAPGYFSGQSEQSEGRCEDECEEVYFSLFTYGKCVGDIFGRMSEQQQPACNKRCGLRLRLWTTIFIFLLFAAALATLFFTLPMLCAQCGTCFLASKANKRVKKTQTTNSDQRNPQTVW